MNLFKKNICVLGSASFALTFSENRVMPVVRLLLERAELKLVESLTTDALLMDSKLAV